MAVGAIYQADAFRKTIISNVNNEQAWQNTVADTANTSLTCIRNTADCRNAGGPFRVRGDVVEVQPANLDDEAIRIEFFGDVVERISEFDPLRGVAIAALDKVAPTIPLKRVATAQRLVIDIQVVGRRAQHACPRGCLEFCHAAHMISVVVRDYNGP